jgi:hypothetical protein
MLSRRRRLGKQEGRPETAPLAPFRAHGVEPKIVAEITHRDLDWRLAASSRGLCRTARRQASDKCPEGSRTLSDHSPWTAAIASPIIVRGFVVLVATGGLARGAAQTVTATLSQTRRNAARW